MKTLRAGVQAIVEGDTGAGGIVTLSGQANPLLYQRSLAGAATPRITYFFLPSNEGTTAGKRNVRAQFTFWTRPSDASEYVNLAEDLRDRFLAVVTGPALAAEGVDAAPIQPQWGDIASDPDGAMGLTLELLFMNAE